MSNKKVNFKIYETQKVWLNRYDPKEKYVPPEVIFKIGKPNHKKNEMEWVDVSHKHSMGLIVGKKKSRKTYAASMIMASAIKNEPVNRFFLSIPDDEVILHFDTEQPKGDYIRSNRKVLEMAECDPKKVESKFYSFRLREYPTEKRREVFQDMIESVPKITGKNVGLVMLDGLVDLCDNFMENRDVQEFTNWLMSLHDQHNFLFLSILHLNKGNGETRGFLGSEMDNKCSFQIKVEKKKDEDPHSTVKFKDGRYAPFPSFTISQSGNGNYGIDPIEDADGFMTKKESALKNVSEQQLFY